MVSAKQGTVTQQQSNILNQGNTNIHTNEMSGNNIASTKYGADQSNSQF